MSSANQLYKKSNSELPFKEWLKREQLKGALKDGSKKEFLNAVGDEDADDDFQAAAQQISAAIDGERRSIFIKGILVGAALGYGIKYYMDKRK